MFTADRPTAEILRVEVTDALAYWTVLAGPTLTVVEDVDSFLCHLRFGRARAESTTKTYAGHLKRFHAWCGEHHLSREHATAELQLRQGGRISPAQVKSAVRWLCDHAVDDLAAAELPSKGATTTYLRLWQHTLPLLEPTRPRSTPGPWSDCTSSTPATRAGASICGTSTPPGSRTSPSNTCYASPPSAPPRRG